MEHIHKILITMTVKDSSHVQTNANTSSDHIMQACTFAVVFQDSREVMLFLLALAFAMFTRETDANASTRQAQANENFSTSCIDDCIAITIVHTVTYVICIWTDLQLCHACEPVLKGSKLNIKIFLKGTCAGKQF